MNNKSIKKYIRFPNYVKYIGLALCIGAFIMQQLQLAEINRTYEFPDFIYSVDLNTPFVMFMLGSVLISISKDKIEDESVDTLRIQALFFSLGLHVIYFLVVSFVLVPGLLVLFNFPAIWLLNSLLFFYLAYFYISKLIKLLKTKFFAQT